MSLNVLKDIRRIYNGLNADQIRAEAHRDLNVGLMAVSEDDYRRLEIFLAPGWADPTLRTEALRGIHRVGGGPASRFDFVLCAPGVPRPPNGFAFDPFHSELTAKAVVAAHPDLELALGRNYPLFRRAVADAIIQRVAKENAMFALFTALPNIMPNLIELPWAIGEFATDTAFLTMNQVRLALLLAAAHGQDVGYSEQKMQIAAVAAGAFGWRAIARELIGKIPLGGGLVPKAAIAFAGTYVVGLGLDKLNRTGSGLSKAEKKDAWAGAYARGKEVAGRLTPPLGRKTAG